MGKYIFLLALLLFLPMTVLAANVEFIADTEIDLTGLDTTLYVLSGSECDSLSVSGPTLSVDIPDASSFSLGTASHNVLGLTPLGGTVTLIFNSDYFSGGYISQWTVGSLVSPSVNFLVAVAEPDADYWIKVDGINKREPRSNSQGETTFTYSVTLPSKVFQITRRIPQVPSSGFRGASFPQAPVFLTGQGKIIPGLGGKVQKTFSSGGSAEVYFPARSIKEKVQVKIEPQAKEEVISTASLPQNTQIVGDLVADFRALSQVQEMPSFTERVSITFTYTDQQIKEVGLDENSLNIHWWDETTGTWNPLESEIDTLTNTVTALTKHFTLFVLIGELAVEEMTVEKLEQKIAEILAKIAQLKAQLQQLLEKEISEIPTNYKFTVNLKYDQRSDDVRHLQMFLKAQESEIYPEGIVSGWFGPLTKKAVIRFQEKYASDILIPWEITEGTGLVGKTTRAKINEILGR